MAELEVEAKIENLSSVNDFVHKVVSDLGFEKKFLMQLDLVVEEIFVNIAEYAYAPEVGSVQITIEIDLETKRLAMTFTDSGRAYNPLSKIDPDINLPIEDREIGGLGIFMVKNLVDEVSYCHTNAQNVLRLEKIF